MKLNLTVNRYIFKELIPPFVMNLVFFMFVFLMRQILEITHVVVNYQVRLTAFFWMLAYSMPYFLAYIVPMSVMMSVLLTFLRLSGDNEIVALKASGVSIYRLLPPVVLFSVLCAVLTAFMSIYGIPWGEKAYRRLAMDVVQSHFNVGLKERQFNDSFDGVMFYVNSIDVRDNSLGDIFIEDQRNPDLTITIVAPRGRIFTGDDAYSVILNLYDGAINQVNLKNRLVHATRFDTYDLRLDLKPAVKNTRQNRIDENEMTLSQLRAFLEAETLATRKYYSVWVEFHKKFSIPFACIALSILAVPLGIQSSSTRKSAGLGIGLMAFLMYYLLLSAALVLGEARRMSPALVMWMPNIIMGGLGIFLLIRTAEDMPVEFFTRMTGLINRMFKIFFRVRHAS